MKDYSNFKGLPFVKPITGDRKYATPYESMAYVDYTKASAVEIDLQKAGLVAIDIDIKDEDCFERDYTLQMIIDNVDLSNAFIEYSKNRGLHIYFKAQPLSSKIIYRTATEKLIEVLNYRIVCTNNPHIKSEFQDFVDFYRDAQEVKIKPILEAFNNMFCIKTAPGINNKNEKVNAQNIVIDTSDRIKYYSDFILKNIGIPKFLAYLGIDTKEYTNYYSFFSLLEEDGNHHGSAVYKTTGVVVDFHTGKKYNFLTYFKNHPVFKEKKVDDVVKELCDLERILFLPFKPKSRVVVDQTYEKVNVDGDYITVSVVENILKKAESLEKKIIQIKANTGTGKTTSFIDYAIKEGKSKFLFIFPYRAQVEQLEKHFANDRQFCFLYEGKTYFSRKRIVISTYDSIAKIIPCEFNEFDYFIIDEYHNIIMQKSFRFTAINKIVSLVNDFQKTLICLTATPEIVFLNYKKETFNVEIKTKQPRNYKSIYKVVINNDKSKTKISNDDIKLDFILQNHKPGNIDVVFCHSRMLLWEMKKIIEARGFKATTICSKEQKLGIDENSKEEYQYIIQNQRFSGKYEFILTTIVLSDGININNNNIDNCYIYSSNPHHFNISTIKQSIARFRKGVNSVYIFNNKKMEAIAGSNFVKIYENIIKRVQGIINELEQNFLNPTSFVSDICEIFVDETRVRSFLKILHPLRYIGANYKKSNYKLNVNNELLKQDLFEQYAVYASKTLQWFFKDMEIIEINGENIDPSDIDDKIKTAKKIAKEQIKNYLKRNPSILHALAKLNLIKNAHYKYENYILPGEAEIDKDEMQEFIDNPDYGTILATYLSKFLQLLKYINLDIYQNNFMFFIDHIFAPNNRWKEFMTNIRLSKIFITFNINKEWKKEYEKVGEQTKQNIYTTYYELEKVIKLILENEKNKEFNKKQLVEFLLQKTLLSKEALESLICSKRFKKDGQEIYVGVLNFYIKLFDFKEVENNIKDRISEKELAKEIDELCAVARERIGA